MRARLEELRVARCEAVQARLARMEEILDASDELGAGGVAASFADVVLVAGFHGVMMQHVSYPIALAYHRSSLYYQAHVRTQTKILGGGQSLQESQRLVGCRQHSEFAHSIQLGWKLRHLLRGSHFHLPLGRDYYFEQ